MQVRSTHACAQWPQKKWFVNRSFPSIRRDTQLGVVPSATRTGSLYLQEIGAPSACNRLPSVALHNGWASLPHRIAASQHR